jgi:predicted O-linked N-acetylglucosamine transferase (SPINDLY family)
VLGRDDTGHLAPGMAADLALFDLRTLGFAELVCADVSGYETLALALAQDPSRRRDLRSGIEAARIASPLFDGATKARQLESLFRRMWDRAVQALPAANLPVED